MATRAVAYLRLSKDTKVSTSIERQREDVKRYAGAQEWDLVEVFEDVDVSGFKRGTKRPGRDGFLAAFDRPDVSVALFYRVDRLARSLLDFSAILEKAEAKGVRLVSTSEGIDPGTSMGRAMLQIIGTFAELESRNISDRVKASNAKLREVGRKGGGASPYGYVTVPNPNGDGKVLAVHDERAEVVRTLARMLLGGGSMFSLVKWLEESRIPTARGGADWHAASVEAILSNPILRGSLHGHHRPDLAIVEPDRYADLQRAIADRHQPGTRPNRPSPGLLSGFVCCGSCAGRLHKATAAKQYAQYRCQNKGCPRQVGISRPALEGHVETELLRRKDGFEVVEWIEDAPRDLSGNLAKIEIDLADTAQAMTADDADLVALGDRLALLKADRSRVREASGVSTTRRFRGTGTPFVGAWTAAETVEAKRDLLASEILAVHVAPGGGRGRAFDATRVEIVWRDKVDGIELPDGTVTLGLATLEPGEHGVVGGILVNMGKDRIYTS